MAAPIQRYSDPRLYGAALVEPLSVSYEWIKTTAHPLHPKCSLMVECAVRAIKVLTGALAIAATSLPALTGRLIQVIHYHAISEDVRLHPPEVIVDGMHLPRLQACPLSSLTAYHGTNQTAAIGILRWGFDPRKTSPGAKMAEAVYVSVGGFVSAAYGIDQLTLSLDLKEGEVAYADDHTLLAFTNSLGKDLSDKKVMASVRRLYVQNGYRAIKYDLDHKYGSQEALAVYDPSCISIRKITPSPDAVLHFVPHSWYRQLRSFVRSELSARA